MIFTDLHKKASINDKDVIFVVQKSNKQISEKMSGSKVWLVTKIISVDRTIVNSTNNYVIGMQLAESDCSKKNSQGATYKDLTSQCVINYQNTRIQTCQVNIINNVQEGNLKISNLHCSQRIGELHYI